MGLRYMVFRVAYELKKKSGYLKVKFPSVLEEVKFPSLDNWKINAQPFFQWEFSSPVKIADIEMDLLGRKVERLKEGKMQYFSSKWYKMGLDEWHYNPISKHTYSKTKHWTQIPEFTNEAGDIKYVWEKARFSWVYSFIRYDQYSNQDSSEFVLSSIESFIHHNPINRGPNYICSQEISLRVLNWVYALYFYKDSVALTEDRFNRIINSINAQITHVYSNINFSRIAVRNNHAITETLTLFLIGMLFPFLPDAKEWKIKGKKWFEEEVEYQIYEDGSYLQYSMNYHRVVVQLLTWVIVISENNEEKLAPIVYEKAKKTIGFLEGCQDPVSGKLPHYGNNDGALFFPLNCAEYRDYRPQINALKSVLNIPIVNGEDNNSLEDIYWYGLKPKFMNGLANQQINNSTNQLSKSYTFTSAGYFTHKEKNTLTFIRCGSHKNRPSQADNLHLDLWIKGQNILRDSGTYLYNGTSEEVAYYNSTGAHNTIQVGDMDQMQRGDRFIWFDWTKALNGKIEETEEYWMFKGSILAFKGLEVQRNVKKIKNQLVWEIEDKILKKPSGIEMHQHWHPNFSDGEVSMSCTDIDKKPLVPKESKGWFAPNYGDSVESLLLTYSTKGSYLFTRIEVSA